MREAVLLMREISLKVICQIFKLDFCNHFRDNEWTYNVNYSKTYIIVFKPRTKGEIKWLMIRGIECCVENACTKKQDCANVFTKQWIPKRILNFCFIGRTNKQNKNWHCGLRLLYRVCQTW